MSTNQAAELSYRELYARYTTKPDLWERRFYYFFSIRLLKRVARTGIMPDDITAVSLVSGIIAAMLLFPNLGYWINLLGVLVLNFSNVCDALDGQLARCRSQYSPLGWLWDVLVDQAKILVITLAIILVPRGSGDNLLLMTLGWLFLVTLAIKHFFHYFLEHNGPAKLWNFHPESEELEKAELLYGICTKIDESMLKAKLGFLTVGEFYLLISLGVIIQLPELALAILILYAAAGLIFNIVFWAARIACLQPRLSHLRQQGASFYIFETNAAGKSLLFRLRREGLDAKLFIDNDLTLSGRTKEGVAIIHPSELKPELPPDRVVLIASLARYEIRDQLLAQGFPAANLILV